MFSLAIHATVFSSLLLVFFSLVIPQRALSMQIKSWVGSQPPYNWNPRKLPLKPVHKSVLRSCHSYYMLVAVKELTASAADC